MSEPHDKIPRASASTTPVPAPSVEATIRRLAYAFAPLQPGVPPPFAAPRQTSRPRDPDGIPSPCANGLAAILVLPPEQRVRTLNRILQAMPPGQRIRNLREILGWTQRRIAEQLGISVRTVIRHEQGHHRTASLRFSILRRLRQLEFEHADEIIRYLSRAAGGPV